MPGSSSTRPFSNAASDWWTAVGSRKISVEPVQIITWRSVFGLELGDVVANLVGEVAFVLAGLLLLRGEPLDVVLVEGGGHRLDGFEERANLFQLVAVEHLRGLRGVVEVAAEDVPAGEDEVVERRSGTKSRISGELASVRLPRRMVPIWMMEPMGLAKPRRTASTPAMSVVATAPMPGIMMPSFPVAGAMLAAA